MSDEIWLPIVGFEGFYEVSDLGRVKSLARIVASKNGGTRRVSERILKPFPDTHGYLQVSLCCFATSITKKIHALVVSAFHGECPNGLEVRHLDGETENCRATNLK